MEAHILIQVHKYVLQMKIQFVGDVQLSNNDEIYLSLAIMCDICRTLIYSVGCTVMGTCMSSMIRQGKN